MLKKKLEREKKAQEALAEKKVCEVEEERKTFEKLKKKFG